MRLQWRLTVFFVLGFLCFSTAASATLLFSGGEDIDFTCVGTGTCSVDGNSSTFRTAWARSQF